MRVFSPLDVDGDVVYRGAAHVDLGGGDGALGVRDAGDVLDRCTHRLIVAGGLFGEVDDQAGGSAIDAEGVALCIFLRPPDQGTLEAFDCLAVREAQRRLGKPLDDIGAGLHVFVPACSLLQVQRALCQCPGLRCVRPLFDGGFLGDPLGILDVLRAGDEFLG